MMIMGAPCGTLGIFSVAIANCQSGTGKQGVSAEQDWTLLSPYLLCASHKKLL
jgi:hypothetical protein